MDEEFVEPQQTFEPKIKKSGGFESMGLIQAVYQAIKRKGYGVPTPIQRKAIPLILAGSDIVACSKTGSGKTAAFIIPLINRLQTHSITVGVRGLILLPTRELALQTSSVIKHFAKGTNLIHSLLVGGHGFEGQFESLAQNPDILIATPGRLMQHLLEGRLSLTRVQMVIFDEADYLFEMGLADQLKNILSFLPTTRQTMIFSATIPEQLSIFAQVGLKDYLYLKLDKEFSLPDNMMVHFLIVGEQHKLSALIFLLIRIGLQDTSIIFASTKYLVDLIVYTLEKVGIQSVSIYGRMDQLDRKEQLQAFRSHQVKVLVVTDLASRGIDIPFVSNVIHYDYPAQSKIFIHRSGRTARAGRQGTVYTLLAHDEVFYIHETMLFAGRKLVNKGDPQDSTKAFYGLIPVDCYANYQAKIDILNKEDPDFHKLQDVQKKANIKFKKTRGSASRASIKNARTIDRSVTHQLFLGDVLMDDSTRDMLQAIKGFKPTQSAIELKRLQTIRRSKDKNKTTDTLLSAISDLKLVRSKAKKNQDERTKLRLMREKNEQKILDQTDDEDEYIDDEKQEKQNQIHKQQQEEYQYHTNDKYKKRSHSGDYKHPTQFMTSQPDYSQKTDFDDLQKIQSLDINAFVIPEDTRGIQSQQRKYMWDREKKKYIRGQKDQTGKIIKDRDDHMRDDKTKATYIKWKKQNLMNIQEVGDREDTQMTDRAKSMFQKRNMRGQGFHYNEEGGDKNNQNRGRNELQSGQQILKSKKIKKNLQLKNMQKGKRLQVETKQRLFKQKFQNKNNNNK